MPRYVDRKNEDIIQFLQREGWWQKKELFEELIKKGELKVNGNPTKVTYKPKKGDTIEFLMWRVTVAND